VTGLRLDMKHVSLFAIFILLTLTLTLNFAYATTITVGSEPYGVAFDSHLNEVFVTTWAIPGTVSVIPDSGSMANTVSPTIPVGRNPHAVAFASNKKEVFVANNAWAGKSPLCKRGSMLTVWMPALLLFPS
jgi:DNA-binding beta-propeller fold protein YncE